MQVQVQVRAATSTIRRFWKGVESRSTARLVRELIAAGPTVSLIETISFQRVLTLVRDADTIALTRACLERIHRLCSLRGGEALPGPDKVPIRPFLAAYMIALHTRQVFDSSGGFLEQRLLAAARSLLEVFERICSIIRDGGSISLVPRELTRAFPARLLEYMARFEEWKTPDEAKLVSRIKRALADLYVARDRLIEGGEGSIVLQSEFRVQIERMHAKLTQLCGAEAVEAFDASCRDLPPAREYFRVVDPNKISNEELAHELLLDPDFRLSRQEEEGAVYRDRSPLAHFLDKYQDDFWGALEEDLEREPPCYVRVTLALSEIREGVIHLAPATQASEDIALVIDLGLIKRKLSGGRVAWPECVGLLGAIAEAMRPVLDAGAALEGLGSVPPEAQPAALRNGLEFLLRRINEARVDAANARLRLLAPIVREHGLDYERGKLQEQLDAGLITLERTGSWLRRAVEDHIAASPAAAKPLSDGCETALARAHAQAMLNVVCGWDPDACPETLRLDTPRLVALHAEFRFLADAAAVLVTAAEPALDALTEALIASPNTADAGGVAAAALLEKPNAAVRALMQARLRAVWAEVLLGEPSTAPLGAATGLLPRVYEGARRLRAVGELNRRVHVGHYLRIAREVAAERRASQS